MAKRKHKGEEPLPALAQDLVISKTELARVLAAGRARVYAEIQRRTRDPAFATDGTARERVLQGIASHYDNMAVELDQWGDELAQRTGGNFFERAQRDTGTANSVTRYDRAYTERWLRLVREETSPSLAAVQTQKMKQADIAALRNIVVSTMQEASVTGMTAKEVRRDMIDKINAQVDRGLPSWQFLDASGKAWTNGNYFDMLTRTITSSVARAGYVDAMVADGFDLATIEGGGDPCPSCAAWRGVVVSVSGANKDFPSLQDATNDGVFHPNCCCEPRYIDESSDKEIIDAQRDLPVPESPDPDSELWRDYANKIAENGALREYDPGLEAEAEAPPSEEQAPFLAQLDQVDAPGGGIGNLVRQLISAGKRTDEILLEVRTQFPNAKTNAGNVAWYRNEMRKKNLVVPPPVAPPVPVTTVPAAAVPAQVTTAPGALKEDGDWAIAEIDKRNNEMELQGKELFKVKKEAHHNVDVAFAHLQTTVKAMDAAFPGLFSMSLTMDQLTKPEERAAFQKVLDAQALNKRAEDNAQKLVKEYNDLQKRQKDIGRDIVLQRTQARQPMDFKGAWTLQANRDKIAPAISYWRQLVGDTFTNLAVPKADGTTGIEILEKASRRGSHNSNEFQRADGSWVVTAYSRLHPDVDLKTVVHELGHEFEARIPGARQAATAFHRWRTQGDVLEKLSDVTGVNYAASEVTRKDAYPSPYCGKEYKTGHTEIISTGLAYMYEDPIWFAKADPKFFKFIFNLTRGEGLLPNEPRVPPVLRLPKYGKAKL